MNERLTEKHIVDNIDCGYKIKKDTCEAGGFELIVRTKNNIGYPKEEEEK